MIQVTSNISPNIVCSAKLACSGNGNTPSSMANSSIWYSCPVCTFRKCSDCTWATIETPPPNYEEIQETSENITEDNASTIEEPKTNDGMDDKIKEEHSGTTPVPGMVE